MPFEQPREPDFRDTSPDGAAKHVSGRPAATTPSRLLTVFEVAELVGCHQESVRRAYLCGQLKRQRFGVRNWRFHRKDVDDWLARGAPTRVS